MARNKRKNVKDKEQMKTIRKSAKKRWRNKKATEKALKNVVDAVKLPDGDKEEKGTRTKNRAVDQT